MTSPTISIVTPSYNQAEFIEDTLRSVRTQRYDDIEHVVVDGESSDDTVEILRQHEDSVQWISEPDDGQSDAINKGFDMVSGDIVGWLNSDDVYFDREVFSRVREYFERYNTDILYGDMALLDPASNVLKIHCVPDWSYDKLLLGCFIEQPALFFRKAVVEDNRLNTGLEYVMDYEFWLRLGRRYEFTHVDDILAGDRNHASRKILNHRDAMQVEAQEIATQYNSPARRSPSLDRTVASVESGFSRGVRSILRTVAMHRNPPELAFDGQLCPLPRMIMNVFRANRTLV